jgi:hypothetical protein
MDSHARAHGSKAGRRSALRAGAWCLVSCLAVAGLMLPGCSREAGEITGQDGIGGIGVPLGKPTPAPPSGQVTIDFLGRSLTCWPYTGIVFNETLADPVNLVFTGQADPLRIRAALLALDGNRTAFGFPDAYPFNATWSDAIGDIQTNWSEGEGWVANYIQLQLGRYEPVRGHLRLFQTGVPFGDGVWTLGGAHFDVLIPGTADHQVLSWDITEQLVVADLVRSGLLDPTNPMGSTGVINATPSYRTIPAPIYNGLPDDLKYLILGPGFPSYVDDPVPIPSDGTATILNLAGAAPIATGLATQSFVYNYEQVIPKPICNPEGDQYVLVTGPVGFDETAGVLPSGRYETRGGYHGTLTITPWDPIHNVPAGAPYPAEVGNHFECFAQGRNWRALSDVRQIANAPGGSEFIMIALDAASHGAKHATIRSRCLSDRP